MKSLGVGCVALACVLWTAAAVAAESFQGKIVSVEGATIKIEFDSPPPKVGDKVQIYFQFAGLDEIAEIGTGRITAVEQKTATAEVEEGGDEVVVGQFVRPAAPQPGGAGGPTGGQQQPSDGTTESTAGETRPSDTETKPEGGTGESAGTEEGPADKTMPADSGAGSSSPTDGQSSADEAQPPTSNLGAEMSEIAKEIAALLKKHELDAVAVGQFTGPAHLASSSGPAISKALSDELQKAGVKVQRFRAELEIKGDYLDVKDKQSGKPAAMIKARVLDRNGQVVGEFQRGVFGEETLAQIFGLTVQLPPDQPQEAKDEAILMALDKPVTTLASNRVMAGPNSPYGLEVLVKSGTEYQSRTPVIEEGFAFVPVERDQSYAVRLVNNSPHEAAVNLTIDGLNMFTFSENEAYKKLGVVIVPAGKTATVKGWFRTNQSADEFLVTEYAKSEAANLHSETDLGTITATFRAAWERNAVPPSDEPGADIAARSANATGRGPTIEAQYNEVERVIGRLRASVSVRYSK